VVQLLLDANLPPSLVVRLGAHGISAAHVGRDRNLGLAPDELILAHARERGEILVTHDLDFGTLLAIEGATTPSVIVLRLRRPSLDELTERIASCLPRVEGELTAGAIVTIEDASIRIRSLPVAG
jgi:predicted nuclease of predicted toxin-antitoxin system